MIDYDNTCNPLSLMEDLFVTGQLSGSPAAFMSLRSGAYVRFEDSFEGPVAEVGDRVEMVCTERTDKQMVFRLRVVEK
ncbi:MAG: hypothetical protein EOO77_14215 [Oxalobacteraceae bacterium]|nr:MAG: hypothetical protein EOO77_14215 [Oxalobacteraceae bacterium]